VRRTSKPTRRTSSLTRARPPCISRWCAKPVPTARTS
jgi:hypothetical protein